MIVKTLHFDHVEIADEEVLSFSEGIYAFEDIKEFVILKQDDDEGPIFWLQAIKDENLCFLIMDPRIVIDDYKPDIPEEILKKLEVTSEDYLRYFVIAVTPKNLNDTTVNLKSPIIINSENNVAMQVILDNNDYSIRHRVFEQSGKVD